MAARLSRFLISEAGSQTHDRTGREGDRALLIRGRPNHLPRRVGPSRAAALARKVHWKAAAAGRSRCLSLFHFDNSGDSAATRGALVHGVDRYEDSWVTDYGSRNAADGRLDVTVMMYV